jgi:hypothetical protein
MSERTQEFLQLVQKAGGGGSSSDRKKIEVPKTKTAFNEAAGEIARGVHKTSGTHTYIHTYIHTYTHIHTHTHTYKHIHTYNTHTHI